MCPMTPTPLDMEWSLLGFLHQQPRHGYALHRKISQSKGLGIVWNLKQSQLYALLDKLERRGYVEHTLEPQASRPPRKVYSLTADGEDALRAWIEAPVDHGRDIRMEFLAKLYFARQEGPEVVRTLLNQQRQVCHRWLDAQQTDEALYELEPYTWLVRRFRAGQIEAILEWLDLCEETLLTEEERVTRRKTSCDVRYDS
jgi:PadR family transcriptional regulator, regulatory protein AphA